MQEVDAMSPTESSPRILVVRLSAIGDVIHGLPVLNALREAFPTAFLGWVVEGRAATLLEGHPALDALINVPRGWLKSPRAVWQLRGQLRKLNFDTTIDVQGLTKSAVAAWLSGAPRRIGFDGAKGRELSRWLNTELVPSTATHIVDCNLELLRPLGIESPTVRFELPERAEDRATAERMIRRVGLEKGFVLINPGAGWPSKLWPADRFAAVAQHFGRTWHLPSVVVWAGKQEQALAHQIVANSQGYAWQAPATSLLELASLARRARLFVASDTGPLHLAAAVGTPCVGLFGPMPAERNGPYGPQHIAIQAVHFEGTSRQRRNAPRDVMEAISIETVCETCDRVLQRLASEAA
jgi:lipopolysaccharide heptosyltransferase I